MANRSFSFAKAPRSFFTVSLKEKCDGIDTLVINMPKKNIFDSINNIENISEEEQVNSIFRLTSVIMSNNKNGIEITDKYIEDNFTIEELQLFITEYFAFVNTLENSPN